jgi:cell fate regulator YaaT (PSP1 superfamily)
VNGPQDERVPGPEVAPRPEARIVQVCFKGHRIDLFTLPGNVEVEPGQVVIVEADRGTDAGTLLRCSPGQLSARAGKAVQRVLRAATKEEIQHLERIREEDDAALRSCRESVEASGLPMRMIDAEFQFDGNRVTFYFTAEGRVDFRSLVRDLAKIFRTRIELRQIHPREAARRQGGVGPCGQNLCCGSFLQSFEPVTLKMAKRQNLALAPTRISGLCGRLLCCLAFDGGECGGCARGRAEGEGA